MRVNGLLYPKLAEAPSGSMDGFNEDGDPIKGVPEYGEAIPCHIKTVTDNRRGRYEDGEFRQATFEVLVEQPAEHFRATEVKLLRDGDDLGEFKVQSVEPLAVLGRIRITV